MPSPRVDKALAQSFPGEQAFEMENAVDMVHKGNLSSGEISGGQTTNVWPPPLDCGPPPGASQPGPSPHWAPSSSPK